MNYKHPKVTVLMPVYNGEKYLREAIESILNQTFTDFEFLIINDASTDLTRDIILSYNDPRIRLINTEHKIGLIQSLNEGIELAKGEYIARMDADDISFLNRLEQQIEFIEQNPKLAVVGGAVIRINKNGVPFDTVYFPLNDQHIKETLLNSGSCIAHPTILIRKKALQAVEGYRKPFLHAEDYDLWLRLADNFELANLSNPVLYLRFHEAQVSYQKLKQQIVSCIGALAVTKIRHETGVDILENSDIVTIDMLSKLGVQEEIILRKFVEGNLFWVDIMHKMDNKNMMKEYLNEIHKLVKSNNKYDFKVLLGNCYINCFLISYHRGKYLEGILFFAKAILSNPIIIRKAPKWIIKLSYNCINKFSGIINN